MNLQTMTVAELAELAKEAGMMPGDYYRAMIEPQLHNATRSTS